METSEAFDTFYREISKICNYESISKELVELSKEELDHINLLKWGKDYLNKTENNFICNDNSFTVIICKCRKYRSCSDV